MPHRQGPERQGDNADSQQPVATRVVEQKGYLLRLA